MKTIEKFDQWVLSIAFAILILFSIIYFAKDFFIQNPEPQVSSWHSNHCLQTVIPANGGSFGEPAGGSYEYTLIARSNGTVEVWKECEK